MIKKTSVIFLLIILLFLPITLSATTIQVNQQEEQQSKGFWAGFTNVLKSKIFWFVIVGFIIIIGILIGILFIVRWVVQFIKLKNDLFYQLKIKRIKLAKVHKTYPSSKFFKFKKNTPIRLVKINEHGKPIVTKPVAYHKGDYITHEGNIVIAFNMEHNKKWFFIPLTEILMIPNYDTISYVEKRGDSNKKIEIKNIPTARNIIQFNEDEILLYADSISNTGQFYVPVLKSKDGKIIDLSFPIYQKIKNVVIGDFLYEQTEEFSKVAKKSVDWNPYVRIGTKLGDTNQSVDSNKLP